jgi:RNA recognition motif-containing protein
MCSSPLPSLSSCAMHILNTFIHFADKPSIHEQAAKLRPYRSDPGVAAIRELSRVYVGSLPKCADDTSLREIMSKFGRVEAVAVIRSSKTGKTRGFGFVDFNGPLDVRIFSDSIPMENSALIVRPFNKLV